MSEQMTNLIQNYIAVWNERDAEKRRLLVDKVFSDECIYIDPNDSVAGRDAIERLVEALQARLPDLRFSLSGTVNAHHDQALFGWVLAAPGAATPAATGIDMAVFDGNRIRQLHGFVNPRQP
jgi:hypothetical protein